MDLGLKGKRALVLGGGSGIGFGIAKALAAEGAHVAIASRNAEKLAAAAETLRQFGAVVHAEHIDLSNGETIEGSWKNIEDRLGGIDILVNNSGGPPPASVADVSSQTWATQFEAMVLSLIKITNLALPGMKERQWGRILTLSSAGVIQPIRNLGISNTLRSALVGWSKSLATDVARDGITANILLAATTRTDRLIDLWKLESNRSGKPVEDIEREMAANLPTGRFGTIDEFGAVVTFIASQQASYITGSVLRVDGGYITAV